MTDFLPSIARGAHNEGEGSACVMEYVSILAGESFSDHPSCTHPVLAEAARTVNDLMTDAGRHQLIPAITRLFGTNPERPAREAAELAAKLARFAADYATEKAGTDGYYTTDPDQRLASFLTALIDEHDAITGRTAADTKVLSDGEKAALLAGAAAR